MADSLRLSKCFPARFTLKGSHLEDDGVHTYRQLNESEDTWNNIKMFADLASLIKATKMGYLPTFCMRHQLYCYI
jgi:hypothetical protein